MNAKEAYDHAYIVLKAAWPEGEATIATDGSYSFYYARDVLQAPFLLGEKAIAECSYESLDYARYVLKAHFPLGERIIFKMGTEFMKNKYKELFPKKPKPAFFKY